jgi:hypothetical protein
LVLSVWVYQYLKQWVLEQYWPKQASEVPLDNDMISVCGVALLLIG